MRVLIFINVLFICVSCAPIRQNATEIFTVENARHALHKTLSSPATWVPAFAAAAFSLGDTDERISDWAIENTPVFGSVERAIDYSGKLLTASRVLGYGSTAWASRYRNTHYLGLVKDLLVHTMASTSADKITDVLKHQVNRRRPNGEHLSFPSGHATRAFSAANIFRLNIYDIPKLNRTNKFLLASFGYLLGSGTAWARVEAGKHYPSDVLAGAAIGNMVSTFFHEFFLRSPLRQPYNRFSVSPLEEGLMLNMDWYGF